jgi:hypothetical protein
MMLSDPEHDRVWDMVYGRMLSFLQAYGKNDPFGKGQYFVIDDDYGPDFNKIEVHDLRMLAPDVISGLRSLLADLPPWSITVAIDVDNLDPKRPMMGLTIRKHEIIDGLDRRYLPPEFANLRYPDSRPGTYDD